MDGTEGGGINAAAAVRAGQSLLVDGFAQWRNAARELLAAGIAPHAVTWIGHADDGDLFSTAPDPALGDPPDTTAADMASQTAQLTEKIRPTLRLPRELMAMLETAACCRVADRWAFLYRVVWRWQHGEQVVLSAADEDGSRLHAMVKAVRREEHDMHAYVRFRERPEADGAPRFVAWFEPAHDVLAQVAQHFVARMGRSSWMIATPDASVVWDGETLHHTGPLLRSASEFTDAADDAGEALWLTYYRSIFNPARLNAKLLASHIPSRFWKNLPEGSVVPEMVSQAAAGARRTGQFEAVGQRRGSTIPIAADKAQPQRETPSTLDQCRRCELWQHATQAVGGAGPQRARLMLVGEQPGDQEDLAGAPFVGPAGQLLDRMILDAGLDRQKIYLTNAVKHFKWEPRGKRRLHKTPAQREVEACRYWLDQELAHAQPDVVVALGSTALKAVLGSGSVALKDHVGTPIRHDGRWVVTVYHPSYVLRLPDAAAKAQARAVIVDGLKLAQRLMAGEGGN